ncbi:unnamed protein product [Closterium sp. NIES-53]
MPPAPAPPERAPPPPTPPGPPVPPTRTPPSSAATGRREERGGNCGTDGSDLHAHNPCTPKADTTSSCSPSTLTFRNCTSRTPRHDRDWTLQG